MGHPVGVSDDPFARAGSALLAGGAVAAGDLEWIVGQATCSGAGQAAAASKRLFGEIVEPLADRFEPSLSAQYARFFTAVLDRLQGRPGFERFNERRLRLTRRKAWSVEDLAETRRCLVLSRVTLGADVAVTSVVLDGLKGAFPEAAITLACGSKAAALFAADQRISYLPIEYQRGGTLQSRLDAWVELSERVEQWVGDDPAGCTIVDPDSRLSQLGLLPVGPAAVREISFDSRAYGEAGGESISELTSRWVAKTFGAVGALPYVAPAHEELQAGRALRGDSGRRVAAMNWGFGGNAAKRVSAEFETGVVLELLRRGWRVVLDKGMGDAEGSAVEATAAAAHSEGLQELAVYHGPLSGFAGVIAASDLFVGYDSAAGHIAAALGTPGIDVFRGAVSPRMLQRWSPWGRRPADVVAVGDEEDAERTLARVLELLP
jgi:ADP-heptose:LPS heptosyltransferase